MPKQLLEAMLSQGKELLALAPDRTALEYAQRVNAELERQLLLPFEKRAKSFSDIIQLIKGG